MRYPADNLRIHKAEMFREIFRAGHRVSKSGLLFRTLESPDGYTRAGFIIRKKILRRAVDRNRYRRILREMVRLRMQTLEKPMWFLFDLKSKISEADLKNAGEFLLFRDVER